MPTSFVDVGTNMAKLLVADWAGGELQIVAEQERYIRLGEGMGRDGNIQPGAIERLRLALADFADTARKHGARQVFAAGTSAVREADNQQDLVNMALRRVGVPLEVLSEADEARWTFAGACSDRADLEAPVAVIDIGGGSTELAVGDPSTAELSFWHSLPLGSVRLTEDTLGPTPADEPHLRRASRAIEKCLNAAQPEGSPRTLLASTATASILATLNNTPSALNLGDVRSWSRRLLALPADEILAMNRPLLKGRADVFPAGILILEHLMQYLQAGTCLISTRRLVHGLAIRHFRQKERFGEGKGTMEKGRQ